MKTLKKEEVFKRNQIENALSIDTLPLFYLLGEKMIMQKSSNNFVVRLRYSFQNETTLYLVMDYLPGGELFKTLKTRGKFDESWARFYAAEVVLGLEYLHEQLDVIYRYQVFQL